MNHSTIVICVFSVNSKVEVRFHVNSSSWLAESVRSKLHELVSTFPDYAGGSSWVIRLKVVHHSLHRPIDDVSFLLKLTLHCVIIPFGMPLFSVS